MSLPDSPAARLVTLATNRLRLTMPGPEAAPHVVSYLEANRHHLGPWSASDPDGLYTAAFWQQRLAQQQQEYRDGRSLRLMVAPADDPQRVIGIVAFSNFVRSAFQACHLGYAIDHRFQGRGFMHEAVALAITHVFEQEAMHRVMANYMPTNERSGRLLRRLGFHVEGYARDYLHIGGAWRDHILTALTSPLPTAPSQAPR